MRSVIFNIMVNREFIKSKIDTLPETVIAKIDKIIKTEEFKNDTDYLNSVPGFVKMLEEIDKDGEWLSEDEVNE